MKASVSSFFIFLVMVSLCCALGFAVANWWQTQAKLATALAEIRRLQANAEKQQAQVDQVASEAEDCRLQYGSAQESLAVESAAKDECWRGLESARLEIQVLRAARAEQGSGSTAPLPGVTPSPTRDELSGGWLGRDDLGLQYWVGQAPDRGTWPSSIPAYLLVFIAGAAVRRLGFATTWQRALQDTVRLSSSSDRDGLARPGLPHLKHPPSSGDLSVRMSRVERALFLDWLEALAGQCPANGAKPHQSETHS